MNRYAGFKGGRNGHGRSCCSLVMTVFEDLRDKPKDDAGKRIMMVLGIFGRSFGDDAGKKDNIIVTLSKPFLHFVLRSLVL